MRRIAGILGLALIAFTTAAQDCSPRDLFRKYEAYKKRFYRHFIRFDRSKTCIGDGIGTVFSADSSAVRFAKEGFGLPATALYLTPADTAAIRAPAFRFNWMDFGSETPSQLGWLIAFLATEYELDRLQAQPAAQQRALEDLFLCLQAVRRLDMQAQYLVWRAYLRRSRGEKLCEREAVGATHFWWWQNCHRGWGGRVQKPTAFEPDFSGYTGFFVRCDAPQVLADRLHDPHDESWNVGMIAGAWGDMSRAIARGQAVDSLCFLAARQHFPSHDQVMSLLYGLVFVKRFVPDTARVTTCDGHTYYPLRMAQRISASIIGAVRQWHLVLPGSRAVCNRWVKLSECEGGNLLPTLFGLKRMNAYIQGQPVKNYGAGRFIFSMMGRAPGGFNREFYLKQRAAYQDLSKIEPSEAARMVRVSRRLHKEVLILANDVLFPEGTPLSNRLGGQAFFDSLLCSAPYGGPCHLPDEYRPMAHATQQGKRLPHGFDCDNIPGWETTRWEEPNWTKDGRLKHWTGARRSNGLDYLILYNLYRLHYLWHGGHTGRKNKW